ncbi:MAG TPA: pyridoxal phosphate-dependent aminotransferase family protein [Candidatus Acetothermia bacterium]|nr:pyridoxal phosphate-dependent aminotransferase family protein [Candidatus Acetothermia bacterium]
MGYPASPREAQEMGLYPFFIPLDQSEGTEVTIAGKRLIMIGSNNYLGLTAHAHVRQAAIEALQRFGPSCTGSRFLNGTLALHEELEGRLAQFVGMEKALVFSTGYQTNLGTLSALVGRGDVIIGDRENHASLVDGSRLALGKLLRFRHNDMGDLERVLIGAPKNAGKLVVVDGVFSMSGEIAPLPDIISLCRKHGARLMVDDAHGMGVTGRGRGTAAHYGLTDEVDLIMGTFSKSFASIGGFIAGEAATIHWIKHLARPLIFSASLPAPNAAAALAALDVMEQEPERVDRVNAIAERMRNGYRELGFEVGASETPIIPILIGDQMKALRMWKALFEAGVYTNVALPPAVPPGESILRTSYMATHTDEQMGKVLAIFARVGKADEVIA